MNPSTHANISEDLFSQLWDMSIGKFNKDPGKTNWGYRVRVIHLLDSVTRGYTTPAEFIEAVNAKYLPEWVDCRESMYQHKLR